ncbi:MAG TPA: HEAT repeat domain-containing protein, partial [Roseimicrobium sp.]|nr:HEAT repeat domain-containing protein [Roseimicrobium sp.]
RTFDNPREMFGYLAYPKGGWVLHMLRSELGPDLYRKCIKTYLERHQYDSVVTEDLRKVIEELSGKPFDQFFDQWLYHAHHPELDVTYSWDEKTKLAKVSIRQVQKLTDNILLFNIPMTLRFKGEFGTVEQSFRIRQKEEDFYFSLKSAPKIARLDPEYTILEKVSFNLPDAMVYAQLADKTDSIGRMLAIEQLANKKNKEAVARLKDVLNNDTFYGVRIEASKALRTIHSDEALDALIASTKQSDARVRQQVVADLGGFYRDTAFAASLGALKSEKNPDIVSAAVRNLGLYSKAEVRETLLAFLKSKSFRNGLATAAVEAMKLQDDPAYIPALLQTLPARESEFQSRSLGQSLGTLAYLARNETKKDDVRELLLKYTQHKMRNLQLAAITALGTLGDPKAIAVLETFVAMPRESRERTAAEQAVAKLRGDRKPGDDLKALRQEVTDLQKSNRDLKKEVEGLKKKTEAKDAAPVAK